MERPLADRYGRPGCAAPPLQPARSGLIWSEVIASPCRNLCQLDPSARFCLGCLRTLEEIAGWPAMTDAQRLAVLQRLGEAAQ